MTQTGSSARAPCGHAPAAQGLCPRCPRVWPHSRALESVPTVLGATVKSRLGEGKAPHNALVSLFSCGTPPTPPMALREAVRVPESGARGGLCQSARGLPGRHPGTADNPAGCAVHLSLGLGGDCCSQVAWLCTLALSVWEQSRGRPAKMSRPSSLQSLGRGVATRG